MEHEAHNGANPFVLGMPVNLQSTQHALDGDIELSSCRPSSIYHTPVGSPAGLISLSVTDEPPPDIEAEGFIHEFLTDSSENPEQPSIGFPVSNAQAITRTRTVSSSSAGTAVPSLGVFHLSIHDLCECITLQRSLRQAIITMTEGYSERSGAILHRFLVLELTRKNKKPIYLRLDRRLGKRVNMISLLLTSGVTEANDNAQFADSKDRLIGGAELENQQVFKTPPTLDKMQNIILVICDELRTYKLWPENCWFFVSLLQQVLGEAGEGRFTRGRLMSTTLASNVRQKVMNRLPSIYRPPSSRLVISFDVGEKDSAVTVAYLPLDAPALIAAVDQWHPVEIHLGRVPTALLYSDEGWLLACGAKAAAAQGHVPFGEQLHHSKKGQSSGDHGPVPLSTMLADYLRYLLRRTQQFLQETTGQDVWQDLGNRAEIVFSHPNDWGANQQKFLEKAAVQAGLITKKRTLKCLHFVGNAQAITSFALHRSYWLDFLFKNGDRVVICNAGDSTVGISTYAVTNRTDCGVEVKELGVPSRLDAGSVHVDNKLAMHPYDQLVTERDLRGQDANGIHDIVDDALRDFRESGKMEFSRSTDPLNITIGGRRMDYPGIQVCRGVMKIESSKADTFFRDVVQPSVDEIARQVEKYQTRVILLTGDFAETPYFRRAVEDRVRKRGTYTVLVNHPTSTVSAMGALSFVALGDWPTAIGRKREPWKLWPNDLSKWMAKAP